VEIIKEDLWPNPLKYFNNVLCFFVFFPSEVLLFILLLAFSVFLYIKEIFRLKFTFTVTLFHCFRKLMKRILMEDGDGDERGNDEKEKGSSPCMHMHAHWRTCTQTYATCMHLYLFIAWLALFDVCIWSLHLGCHRI